jgi:hypothetical protein
VSREIQNMTQNGFMTDPTESLEMILASIKMMEAMLLGMKQVRQYVSQECGTEMLDMLIHRS